MTTRNRRRFGRHHQQVNYLINLNEALPDKPAWRPIRRRGWTTHALLIVWGSIIACGMGIVWQYERTAGPKEASPNRWPEASRLVRPDDRFTLVMFVHPKCPCTRASLRELARVVTEGGDRLKGYVVFIKPSWFENDPDWERTDLWRTAEGIASITPVTDLRGAEANVFRAETSGLVLLYDRDGRLKFEGGITASRGHSGDNLGRATITELLRGNLAEVSETEVYGCELETKTREVEPQCCQK